MDAQSKGMQPSYAPPPGPPPSYHERYQQPPPQSQYQQPGGIPPQHAHNSYYASFGHLYGTQPQYNQSPGFRHSYGGSPSPSQQMHYNQQPGLSPQPGQYLPPSGLSPHSADSAHFGQSHHHTAHGRHSSHSSRPSQSLSPYASQHRPSSASSYGSFAGGSGAGFSGLPPRIEVWCSKRGSSGDSYHMEIGPESFGQVFYAAKMGMGKLKIKQGLYTSDGPAAAEAVEKGFLSSKSILKVNGYETGFDGGTNFSSGAKGTFQAPRDGRTETWEWRRKKAAGGLMDKLSRAMSSKMGDWELCPAGGSQVVATWTQGEGNGMAKNKTMGVLEFHGQAAMGDMGDTFHSVAILAMLRILQLRFQSEVASAVGSAAGG